ncbi:hypothetical protein SAMN05421880_11274 [Nitrosomonas nitrosa]|uniref:Uncharacterized protein n=1 Tax=Nitrosomonas nitrosa TaxID=52442 RepID=A0A1I4PT49_9PROT|nr:hypothetical protein [Nitrosomonas nitrosa]SFM30938.1 hypothetical protein SAMN05421880_11274 [Nitrosomonas nitrosa]
MRKFRFNFNLLLPALLAALLFIPFLINSLTHYFYGEKQFPPIVMMKLPVESTAISLPTEVVQFTPFEVTLQLDTEALANRLNDIIARSPHGVAMQGISGKVHASMQAEIVGNGFHIDNPGPQVQLFSGQSGTLWSWTVTPTAPNRHQLAIRLHLITLDNGQENQKVVDIAEIQTYAQKNPAEWIKRYGIWFIIAGIVAFVLWRRVRRPSIE